MKVLVHCSKNSTAINRNSQSSTTLNGNGEGILDFGNCWTQGIVKVFLNGNEVGYADKNTPSKTITFEYTDGAELKICDEGANSVIQFNQFTVTKLLNHHQIRCIWKGTKIIKKIIIHYHYTVKQNIQ